MLKMNRSIYNKNTILLLTGYLVSGLGDSIYLVSLTFFVLEKFKDPTLLGVIMAVAAMSQLIFGFIAGQIVDRLDLRKMIVISDFIRAIFMIIMLALIISNTLQPVHIIIITFCISTIGVFFNPAISAVVPRICNKDNLNQINSALYALINVAAVVGPVAGGILYSKIGFSLVVLINAISYGISGISEIGIKINFVETVDRISNKSRILTEILAGVKIILGIITLRRIIVFTLITNIFFIPFFELLLPLIISQELELSAEFYGSILTSRAVGTIIGSFIVYKLGHLKNLLDLFGKTTFIQGFVVMCVGAIAILANMHSLNTLFLLYALLFIAGLISAVSNIPLNIIIQKNAPTNRVATVFSTMSTLFRVVAPLTLFIFGFVMNTFKASSISFAIGGAIMLLAVIFINIVNKNKNKESSNNDKVYDF